MKAFAALNPRERRLVSIVLPLAIVVVGYQFLWAPLQRAQAEARADFAGTRRGKLGHSGCGVLFLSINLL